MIRETKRRHLAGAADWERPARGPDRSVPTLRFTPWAWAKLLFLRDIGPTEVGGFGISAADDLFLVRDVRLVRQMATAATVAFEDEAVADFFDEQVEQGRKPEEFGRIWVHTHPGASPEPSVTDEETFERVFGRAGWAVMFILARGGASYARLRFGCGPGAELQVPVTVEYSVLFPAADHAGWEAEYAACVQPADSFALAAGRQLVPDEIEPLEFAGFLDQSDPWPAGTYEDDFLCEERSPYDV